MTTFESIGNLPRTFTTGDAARIFRISQREIIRSIDSGMLKGYHIPGSHHRRVPANEMEKFALAYGLDAIIPRDRVFMILAKASDELKARVQALMATTLDASKIHIVSSSFEAGLQYAAKSWVDQIFIDQQERSVAPFGKSTALPAK